MRMLARDNEEKDNVRKTWQVLFRQQQEKNPWPKVLGEEFLKMIEVLPPDKDIPRRYCEMYQNIISKHFPTLLLLVDVRLPHADAVGPADKSGMSELNELIRGKETRELVDWDAKDFETMMQVYNWGPVPSSLQVRLAQEDLWVYEALLRIIRETNRDASSHENAAVKRIEGLKIGKEAADVWVKGGSKSSQSAVPVGMGMGMGMLPAVAPSAGVGVLPGLDAAAMKLKDDRYVDDKGRPLKAGDKLPFPEFKMMPIYMRLVVDQRKVPLLLVRCATRTCPSRSSGSASARSTLRRSTWRTRQRR